MDSNWEIRSLPVSVTAETDCSLMVPLSVVAISGKTTFGYLYLLVL